MKSIENGHVSALSTFTFKQVLHYIKTANFTASTQHKYVLTGAHKMK